MDLKQLADTFVNKVKKDYASDVSLIHIHGSYIYGNTHNRSDLDIFFVPRTERGYKLGTTFILDGIGCDFWALPWERLERIANHNESIVSILTEGEILYYYSNENPRRFNDIVGHYDPKETVGFQQPQKRGGEKPHKDYKPTAVFRSPSRLPAAKYIQTCWGC